MRRIHRIMLAAILVVSGCADNSTTDVNPGQLAIDTTPVLVLGADETAAEQQFFRISDVAVWQGGILVADRGNSEILSYDSAGDLVFRAGGQGAGPAEFQALTNVGRWDDTSFYAFDAFKQRISLWSDSKGTVIGAFPLYHDGTAQRVRRRSDGGFVMALAKTSPMPRTVGDQTIDSVLVVSFDSLGNPQQSNWRLPLRQQRAVPSPTGGTRVTLMPFDPEGILWLGPERAYYGWSADSTILRLDYATGKTDTVTLALPSRKLTPAIIEAWIEDRLSRSPAEDRSAFRTYYTALPFPPSIPRYDRIVEDVRGRVWLRRYTLLGDSVSHWLVAAAGGQIEHEVTGPPRLDPMDIGDDIITGILQDDLDRYLVVQLRIQERK